MVRPRMHESVKLTNPIGAVNRAYKNEVGEVIHIKPTSCGTLYKLRMSGGHVIEVIEDEIK